MSSSKVGKALPYQLSLARLPPYNADAEAVPEPPSPVPTEIIDIDAEDFVRTSKQHGVKVRDFAYEDSKPSVPRAPEIWRNPFLSLLAHDVHIRRPHDPDYYLPGKVLHRLLDIGLVEEEEAKRHWTPADWQRLKVYQERLQGPYPYRVGIKKPKPTAKYRVASRLQFWGDPLPGDIPDAAIYVPEDGPDSWDGDEESEALGQLMRKRRINSAERKREAARMKAAQTQSQPQSFSQTESESQSFEYSQTSNPIIEETSRHNEVVPTPPMAPVALPEDRRSLGRSASYTNINSLGSASAGSSSKHTSRTRKIGRTETLSMLLVR